MRKLRVHLIQSIPVTALVAVFGLLPLYWMLITSFKPPGTEFRLPIEYWPSNFSVESYQVVLGPDFRVQRAILINDADRAEAFLSHTLPYVAERCWPFRLPG